MEGRVQTSVLWQQKLANSRSKHRGHEWNKNGSHELTEARNPGGKQKSFWHSPTGAMNIANNKIDRWISPCMLCRSSGQISVMWCSGYARPPHYYNANKVASTRTNTSSAHHFCQTYIGHKLLYTGLVSSVIIGEQPIGFIIYFGNTKNKFSNEFTLVDFGQSTTILVNPTSLSKWTKHKYFPLDVLSKVF